jgi:hypothetical protein
MWLTNGTVRHNGIVRYGKFRVQTSQPALFVMASSEFKPVSRPAVTNFSNLAFLIAVTLL